MAALHLFRGHPGSSKSTSAQRMFPGVVLFENDQFLMKDGKYCWSKDTVKDAVKWCYSSVENALKHGMDVCVANTFTKYKFVHAYKMLADKYGANFEVYRCSGNYKNVHGLNDAMVESFKKSMEDYPGEFLV